ncbi:hypothetical protein KEM55_006208 [Ascosphaera atra]|nr:hypothetical protein KEM55_006208 [Ascosphaera atra]
MSVSKTEADIIFDRANVALARSQRLVASWLPKSDEETSNTKTEAELQREEDEIFTPVPEKLGLGAPLPSKQADGSFNRTELSSNDQLRRQLLGKNYKKILAAKQAAKPPADGRQNLPQQQQQRQQQKDDVDDDDEEEGRSSLGKKRQISGDKSSQMPASRGGKSKRGGSYLDEVLQQRSKKKKKKSKSEEE